MEAGTGQSLVPVVWAADHLVVAMYWQWAAFPWPVVVLNLQGQYIQKLALSPLIHQ